MGPAASFAKHSSSLLALARCHFTLCITRFQRTYELNGINSFYAILSLFKKKNTDLRLLSHNFSRIFAYLFKYFSLFTD